MSVYGRFLKWFESHWYRDYEDPRARTEDTKALGGLLVLVVAFIMFGVFVVVSHFT